MVAGDTRNHLVPSKAAGERLDAHLSRVFTDLSRARLQALIDEGHLVMNGQVHSKSSARLRGGEQIRLFIPAPAPATPVPQDLPLAVLYEDADLIALDKAAGMVVHPAAGHADGTLVNALLHRVKDLKGVGGELRPGIVHRLDKDTSGCLVVAKHERALVALQQAFKGREVKKRYLAIVHGTPAAKGTIDSYYGRHPRHRKKFTGKLKQGKRALTTYEVREAFKGAALVEVDLHTGRTHQIRVHLAEAGHPLLANPLYGAGRRGVGEVPAAAQAIGRQALHAWKLELPHPMTGDRLTLEAPLPTDFEAALDVLRG